MNLLNPPRRDGFPDETLIVLPETVVEGALQSPLLRRLVPVAAGFFPRAVGHRVERQRPLPESIVIVCVAGRGWVSIGGGRRHPVGAHSLVLIPPGMPHAYGADDVAPWSIHWFHLRGEEVADYRTLLGIGAGPPVIRFSRAVDARIGFTAIYERLEEDYTFPNLLSAAARVRLMLTELCRLNLLRPSLAKADPVERAIGWMREHLAARAHLPSLARYAGLSPPRFSDVFRQRTGYPPVDYFLRMKVRHACRLLDTTRLPVKDIAAMVGYDDPFYFSRLFRRIMTLSPRAYRATPKG